MKQADGFGLPPAEVGPWVECGALCSKYWAAIADCRRLQDEGADADPKMIAEAEQRRVACRDVLIDYRERMCRCCARCSHT